MYKPCAMNRRRFLAGAAGAFGVGSMLSRSGAWGEEAKVVGPCERVAIGCIGVGGMGRGDMGMLMECPNAQVVAICDVKPDARELASAQVNTRYGNKDCSIYTHFEELVARPDIDAVLIASPDHWHVLHALAAVKAGKDVYVEKPMGVSIAEVQALRAAIKTYGRVFQFGTQQRSMREFRVACELARNGRLGKLVSIDVGVHAGSAERTKLKTMTPAPIPEGFDYDRWLGPAFPAPFVPQRVINPHWFHISDYSLGYVSGWGIHHIDIAQWGHGSEFTGPTEIDGTAVFPSDDALCDNPVAWDVRYLYADGVTMHFTGAGPGVEGVRHGVTFRGTDGWVWVTRGDIEASSPALLKEYVGPDETQLAVSTNHQQNFIDCVRSRGDTIANIDVGSRSDIVCQLGWIAFMLKRKLNWDPKNETFINDPEANRLMSRAMRAPWSLS